MTTGAFPVGMADINNLITFPDQNAGAAVVAGWHDFYTILIAFVISFFPSGLPEFYGALKLAVTLAFIGTNLMELVSPHGRAWVRCLTAASPIPTIH